MIADHVRIGRKLALAEALEELSGNTAALRLAAIRWIEGASPVDQSFRNRAYRLVGRTVPLPMVEHPRERIAVALIALAVTQRGVEFPLIIRMVPGTVVVLCFQRAEQLGHRRLVVVPALEIYRVTARASASSIPRRTPLK
jgi:hypothetical protein